MADRNARDRQEEPIEPNDAIEQGEDTRDERVHVRTPGIPGHTAPIAQNDQRTRKGQAQSPREMTHNEPPKHKEGHHH